MDDSWFALTELNCSARVNPSSCIISSRDSQNLKYSGGVAQSPVRAQLTLLPRILGD